MKTISVNVNVLNKNEEVSKSNNDFLNKKGKDELSFGGKSA